MTLKMFWNYFVLFCISELGSLIIYVLFRKEKKAQDETEEKVLNYEYYFLKTQECHIFK